MDYPSEKDIQEAKSFLIERLSAEQSGAHNMGIVVLLALQKILNLCKAYSIKPSDIATFRKYNSRFDKQLKSIIDSILDDLYYVIEDLCVHANKKDREYIVAFMNKKLFSATLVERLRHYSEAIVNETLNLLGEGEKLPTALSMAQISGMHNYKSLDRLIRHTIARTYMEELRKQNKNAAGFWSYRGSSYPCTQCDDYVGWHPMKDYALPLHPNCCCFPVFTNDKP